MNYGISSSSVNDEGLKASQMTIGDIAIILEDWHHGQWLLRHRDGWILLNSPTVTWGDNSNLSLRVRKLGVGEKIILVGL